MRNPCKECDYYHKENNTCQSKKCCTGGYGYITWIDRLFCKPYKYTADRKDEPQRNMAEDIVESFGFKAESYRQAKAKTEQTERSE